MTPRLLTIRDAAAYCSVSFWTMRDWIAAGLIPTIQLPPLRPREGAKPTTQLRRVLIDRHDLDVFIEARKRRVA